MLMRSPTSIGAILTLGAVATLTSPAIAALRLQPDVPRHVYVASEPGYNKLRGHISVFPLSARGDVAPEYAIGGATTQLESPLSEAFDGKGNLYVFNSGYPSFPCDSVVEFARGARGDAHPLRVIQGPNTGFCQNIFDYGFAVTPGGDIYVPIDYPRTVAVFGAHQNGNVAPNKTLTYISSPTYLQFDAKGNLWNDNFEPSGQSLITGYSPSGTPLGQFLSPGYVYGFVIARDLIYTPSMNPNVVVVTSRESLKTRYSFQYPRNVYWNVTVDDAGNMYFLYFGPRRKNLPPAIEIYAPGGSSPMGEIDGRQAALANAGWIQVGP